MPLLAVLLEALLRLRALWVAGSATAAARGEKAAGALWEVQAEHVGSEPWELVAAEPEPPLLRALQE